jgi:hypothetical protein
VGNRFYVEDKDTESADSAHFITALYDRGTTPEDGSICSSESWDQKGSPAHNDFGVDPKTHRRKVVSMVSRNL